MASCHIKSKMRYTIESFLGERGAPAYQMLFYCCLLLVFSIDFTINQFESVILTAFTWFHESHFLAEGLQKVLNIITSQISLFLYFLNQFLKLFLAEIEKGRVDGLGKGNPMNRGMSSVMITTAILYMKARHCFMIQAIISWFVLSFESEAIGYIIP